MTISMTIRMIGIVVWCLASTGCAELGKSAGNSESDVKIETVEIAPNKWLDITRIDNSSDHRVSADNVKKYGGEFSSREDWTRVEIPLNGKTLVWLSTDFLISLREWNDSFYIVGFGEKDHKERLRYYKQEDTGFREISAKEYPRKIASQNLRLSTTEWHTRYAGGKYRPLDLTRDFAVNDESFGHTLTARIWWDIEKGGECFPQGIVPVIPQEFPAEFQKKYDPIRLPTIVKEDSDSGVSKEAGVPPVQPPPAPPSKSQ
jgi:hypothetical protein